MKRSTITKKHRSFFHALSVPCSFCHHVTFTSACANAVPSMKGCTCCSLQMFSVKFSASVLSMNSLGECEVKTGVSSTAGENYSPSLPDLFLLWCQHKGLHGHGCRAGSSSQLSPTFPRGCFWVRSSNPQHSMKHAELFFCWLTEFKVIINLQHKCKTPLK